MGECLWKAAPQQPIKQGARPVSHICSLSIPRLLGFATLNMETIYRSEVRMYATLKAQTYCHSRFILDTLDTCVMYARTLLTNDARMCYIHVGRRLPRVDRNLREKSLGFLILDSAEHMR